MNNLKSVFNIAVLALIIFLAVFSIFKVKKIASLKEQIRVISEANGSDSILIDNQEILHKIDTLYSIIYEDSIEYTDGMEDVISENRKLKRKLYRQLSNKSYENLEIWLRDSLRYYDVFKRKSSDK